MTKKKEKKFGYLEMEAALCVWECINDWTLRDKPDDRQDWIELREAVGSGEMRHQSIALGQWCLKIWDILTAHDKLFFDGLAYDWEVIPMMLNYARDDNGKPVIHEAELPPVERIALFVAREHLSSEYASQCTQEAQKRWAYGDLIRDHWERADQAFEMGEEPAEFVRWLGEKYDLTPLNEWLNP